MSDDRSLEESFETAFETLQKTVQQLESGELSLEDSLKKFEEGVRLTRKCQKVLNDAQKRVEVLTQATDTEVQTQAFTAASDAGHA